jgi:carbamoyl-phosphate synthase small subunit
VAVLGRQKQVLRVLVHVDSTGGQTMIDKVKRKPALLALEDGTLFYGESFGAEGMVCGEVVFNTSMTGYQEIVTDPSYSGQLVTLTYPHIGNVGVTDIDAESDRAYLEGLIIRDLPRTVSNWRSELDLDAYLKKFNIPGITHIDTRKLTRILRDKGAQNGALQTGQVDEKVALEAARSFPGIKGMDLAKTVSRKEVQTWRKGSWNFELQKKDTDHVAPETLKYRVAVYDFGVKTNILRMLVDRGCDLTIFPAQTPASEVLAMNPDGVFLSNGPGDPAPCEYAIQSIKEILDARLPLFGICLGHQLLGLAYGAQSEKMKFGHHGANHPVMDLNTGKVVVTTQNHGFALNRDTLPETLKETHRSLFDGSLQGIHGVDRPAFSFQGHPEASSGPHDVAYLFDHFIDLMREHKQERAANS